MTWTSTMTLRHTNANEWGKSGTETSPPGTSGRGIKGGSDHLFFIVATLKCSFLASFCPFTEFDSALNVTPQQQVHQIA